MGTHSYASRLVIGLLIVAFLIVLFALAQGIGQSVGHGLTEWNIR